MAGIGSTLREARMRAHLDITDFEARTKIRAKYLRALEDEEWNLLPGYPFAKGFLRTYADMLGLDGRALVDEFKRQYRDPSEHDLAPSPPTRRDGRRPRDRHRQGGGDRGLTRPRPTAGGPRRPVPIAVVVVVLAVLLAAALYALGKIPSGSHPRTTSTTSTRTSTSRSHTRTTTTTPPPAVPVVAAVQLHPSGRVYVCLVGYPASSNRRRHVRINGLVLTPATPEPVYHDNHFLVTFGNNALAMVINGRRHTVPSSKTAISYEISRDGTYRTLAASQAPHCP